MWNCFLFIFAASLWVLSCESQLSMCSRDIFGREQRNGADVLVLSGANYSQFCQDIQCHHSSFICVCVDVDLWIYWDLMNSFVCWSKRIETQKCYARCRECAETLWQSLSRFLHLKTFASPSSKKYLLSCRITNQVRLNTQLLPLSRLHTASGIANARRLQHLHHSLQQQRNEN